MKHRTYFEIILKATAIFLWYFVALFFFIIWDLNRANPILKEGSILGDMMVRFPYQWDFELFFAGLFLVWGIYIWRAAKHPHKNASIITFTGWAFLVHAITMVIVGIIKTQDFMHLIIDSIPWFVLSALIFISRRQGELSVLNRTKKTRSFLIRYKMNNKYMSKKRFIVGAGISFVILILISAYILIKPDPENGGVEQTVSWSEAIRILNSGEVKQVTQLHSLEVTFILKDGTRIKTKEPNIDDIYDEIEKCANTCKGMILATE